MERNCSDRSYITTNKTALGTTEDQVLYGIIIAIFATALYLAGVLILYVCMNGFEEKPRKRQFTQKVFTRKLSSIEGNLNHSRQFYRTSMFTLCITIALLLVVQLCVQQVLIFKKTLDKKTLQLALKYIFGLQIVLGYVFMWVRQRLFYFGSSPLRNLLNNKTPLLFLSSFSLTFVLINVIVQLALAWYWNVCTILYEALTWFILCLFVQGTLIWLFLYPLWTLNHERKRFLKSTNGNGRVFFIREWQHKWLDSTLCHFKQLLFCHWSGINSFHCHSRINEFRPISRASNDAVTKY